MKSTAAEGTGLLRLTRDPTVSASLDQQSKGAMAN
jgi:hypothetical protein